MLSNTFPLPPDTYILPWVLLLDCLHLQICWQMWPWAYQFISVWNWWYWHTNMCVILCGGRATFLLRVNCCESDDHNCSLVIFCDFPLLEQLLVEQGPQSRFEGCRHSYDWHGARIWVVLRQHCRQTAKFFNLLLFDHMSWSRERERDRQRETETKTETETEGRAKGGGQRERQRVLLFSFVLYTACSCFVVWDWIFQVYY